MRKKTMADGILGISAAAALASAPFQEGSMAAAALFHLSFAASVGGFADWFGVTSLFRKPLGIPFRTNLIARSRDKIVAMARDMVTEEILSERRLKRLLVNHVPSAVVEHWLKEHREELHRILSEGLESAFSSLHEEWLWKMTGGSLASFLPSIDWASCLASVMLSFKNYEKKEELSQALEEEVRRFLQDEFTLEEIGNIYRAAWDNYEAHGPLNFHRLFRKALKDRDEEFIRGIQKKIFDLADTLADGNSEVRKALGEKYDGLLEKLTTDSLWKEELNRKISGMAEKLLEEKGKDFFLKEWQNRHEELAGLLAGKILSRIEDVLGDKTERRRFDAWLLSLVLPRLKEIHGAVASVVEKKLSQYDGEAMARLAEEAASEEVAAIRMNGSLFGALLGLAFFAAGVMR
ncbi:DUF445 family protein [Dialister sp.]|uniref:DUF445 family protein n=1 Tax=Dialister sp. TaxID=1955814 RepID=UPI003F1228E9